MRSNAPRSNRSIPSRFFFQRGPGVTALLLSLAVILPAATARADLHCGENFDGTSVALEDRNGANTQLGSCGTWTNPTSEWSTDTTSFTGNAALRRNDANVPGVWSDSHTPGTYGASSDANVSVSANVMVDSWNGTDSQQQAALYGRFNSNTSGWYGVTVGYDGWLHLKKKNAGTVVTFTYVDASLGRDIAALNINAQAGVWYGLRLELHNIYSGSTLIGVQLNAYVNGALAATFTDDGSVAGALIENGSPGAGSKGCKAVWDDVVVGNGNDDGSFNDANELEESGVSASNGLTTPASTSAFACLDSRSILSALSTKGRV
jgi:hypothetical protein